MDLAQLREEIGTGPNPSNVIAECHRQLTEMSGGHYDVWARANAVLTAQRLAEDRDLCARYFLAQEEFLFD